MGLALLALLVLAGCADGPPVAQGLARLAGKPVVTAYVVLGMPTKQAVERDLTLHTWDTPASGKSDAPGPTMAAGFTSSAPRGREGNASTGATLGHETTCEVPIRANGDGKIKAREFVEPASKRPRAWANSGAWTA